MLGSRIWIWLWCARAKTLQEMTSGPPLRCRLQGGSQNEYNSKLDGVGPVDNRPSTDYLNMSHLTRDTRHNMVILIFMKFLFSLLNMLYHLDS